MKNRIWLFCLLACTVASAQPGKVITGRTGYLVRDYKDSSRLNWQSNGPRPLHSVIWYPAGIKGVEELVRDKQQFSDEMPVFRDADIAGNQKYPLILLSHGAKGNAMQMRWLGYFLASNGFIAVAIGHNGTIAEERAVQNITLTDFCMWERPRDISTVLTKVLSDPLVCSRIDTGRIGVAGFSLGGASAIWLAGAIMNREAMAKSDPNPPAAFREGIEKLNALAKTDPRVISSLKHSSDSFKDKRIKAVFALAPAIGQGFTKVSLHQIQVPVQIVVGDADVVAPGSLNAAYYTANIPSARKLIVLPGERGHYTRPPLGSERPEELLEVSVLARRFFNEVFKQISEGKK